MGKTTSRSPMNLFQQVKKQPPDQNSGIQPRSWYPNCEIMIDFKFQPTSYFPEGTSSNLLAKLHYPESIWGEQISIYAHSQDGKILFEAVDFYGNDYLFYPSSCLEPLSLEDFIYLIEGMQLNQDTREGSMDLVLDGIPEAESGVYPRLKKYFEEKRKTFGLE
jgi:hypothetical protein